MRKELSSLYEHLQVKGLKLEEILHSFYKRMAADTMIGFFFSGRDLLDISKKQEAFLLRSMGIATEYPFRPPQKAHSEIPPIMKGHFNRRLVILRETLSDFDLAPAQIDVWIRFEESFRQAVQQQGLCTKD